MTLKRINRLLVITLGFLILEHDIEVLREFRHGFVLLPFYAIIIAIWVEFIVPTIDDPPNNSSNKKRNTSNDFGSFT